MTSHCSGLPGVTRSSSSELCACARWNPTALATIRIWWNNQDMTGQSGYDGTIRIWRANQDMTEQSGWRPRIKSAKGPWRHQTSNNRNYNILTSITAQSLVVDAAVVESSLGYPQCTGMPQWSEKYEHISCEMMVVSTGLDVLLLLYTTGFMDHGLYPSISKCNFDE